MPSASDVITTALTVALPCPVCGRPEWCPCDKPEGYSLTATRAALIEAALIEHGHLKQPAAALTEDDVREAAMYLAGRSRHPRYIHTDDGWMRLLESQQDVNMAYAQAAQNVPQSEIENLGLAKSMLLTALAGRR